MRHLPAGHCGGCGDPFETCTCDAMGIPAPKPPKASKPDIYPPDEPVVVFKAQRDEAIDLLVTVGERVLTERRARENVRNARTYAIRAATKGSPHDADAEQVLAAVELQHASALAALNECLVHMGVLDPAVSFQRVPSLRETVQTYLAAVETERKAQEAIRHSFGAECGDAKIRHSKACKATADALAMMTLMSKSPEPFQPE